jgi:acyl-CoA synthetase (AMP-forming)/AMP-acid ligase II
MRDCGSCADLLRERAKEQPDRMAFRFVDDAGAAQEITYAQLRKRASAVAARMLENADEPTRPALLLYPPGLDYVTGLFACFHAGVPAVPAFPPGTRHLDRAISRLHAMLLDSGADLILTTSHTAPVIEAWLSDAVCGKPPRVLATDTGEGEYAAGECCPAPARDATAVLQYTSGSTSLPRGVMLSNAQLIANCADISRAFGLHDASSAVLWLPPYHDMGLIGGILTPIAAGIPATFISPQAFLRHPMSWLYAVSRYRGTITGGPNFAYDLCVKRAANATLEGLDLSCLELTFTGAEPVQLDTIRRFAQRFAPYGFRPESFYPCYGLAEATLYVTGSKVLQGCRSISVARDPLERDGIARPAAPGDPARVLVSCGTPGPGTRVLIVDPVAGEPSGPGKVGEIWVSSPSVADGYWRRPAETAQTFGAVTRAGDGPFLRTGDLGFRWDDELFIAGRMKDLIVLNGRNYHPTDIEQVCEGSVADIRRNCGAAFAVADEANAREQLVIVYEVNADLDEQRCKAAADGIRRAVSREVGVPPSAVVLIAPRAIPKTSSGKVQRWLCRKHYLQGELEAVVNC